MILHHYAVSPYSEMIRLMFGYTEQSWQSSVVPPMPPRPSLDPIVGGYRRIPIAQIGADVFCDTRLICDELAQIANKPALSFNKASADAVEFADHVHETIFMSVVQTAEPKQVLKMLVTKYWPWQIAKLAKDRATVGKQMKGPRLRSADRKQRLDDFKATLETKLSEHTFLFGDEPSVADFAAYHLVWFADKTRQKRFLGGFHNASAWQNRMQAFGQGRSHKLSADSLAQLTKESEPREVGELQTQHKDIGKTVTIQPDDYADDATTGQLVGADQERWIIARHTSEFGTVHVHFPVQGYALTLLN